MLLCKLVLGAVLLLFAAALFCCAIVFLSPHPGQNDIYNIPKSEQYQKNFSRMHAGIEALAALPADAVTIRSRDGLTLCARYYHSADGAPLALCFHGYRATAIRDFSGGARYLLALGMNVLLVDERAQGKSGGHVITFGARERYDCADWIAYAAERFGADAPIFLYGVSMGAATVLLASALPLPAQVRGIVADSPYSSAAAIIRTVCRAQHLPSALLCPLISLGARLFCRFRLEDADAVSAAKESRTPILILHGEDDRFVPCAMSETIRAANPAIIRRFTFPNAGHGLSYIEDTPRYTALVEEFMQDCLAEKAKEQG